MEGKIKSHRANIAKFLEFCEDVSKSPEIKTSKGYLDGKSKMIDCMWNRIQNTNDEIAEGITSELEVTVGPNFEVIRGLMEKEFDRAFVMFDTVTILICKAVESLSRPAEVKVQPLQLPENLVLQTGNNSGIKLKSIDIPTFTGDYTKWLSFKNMFESLVHDKKELSNVQKMHYLKSSLGGTAERLIAQFDITEAAYGPAYELVKDRYHNEVILIDSHIISILSQRDLTSESSDGLKEMLDVTTENLRALNSLGIDTDSWDPILLLLLIQKLDSSSRRLWEQTLKPKVRPTMKGFLTFLAGRFHALGCQQKFKFSMESNTKQAAERTNKKDFSYGERHQISDNFKNRSQESFFPPRTHQSFHNSTEPQGRCPFRCSESHDTLKCDRFLKADVRTRFDMVTCARLCKNCLRNHRGKCSSRPECHKCNSYHHTMLHPTSSNSTSATNTNHCQVQSSDQNQIDTNLQSHHIHIDQNEDAVSSNEDSRDAKVIAWDEKVLLATAIVLVKSNRDNRFYPFRALIDQASEASYVSEYTVQTLGLIKKNVIANTSGLGGVTTGAINYVTEFEVGSKRNMSFSMQVQGPVVNKITNSLPSSFITKGDWKHIQPLHLADPQYDVPSRIDLLLGAPVYGYLLLPGLIKASPVEPVAQNTEFGWILSGPVRETPALREISIFHLKLDLDRQLKKFFELEEVSKERIRTQEETECEKFFMETYKRKEDGRFVVALPFKANPDTLGSSKGQAISRFTNLEQRFKVNESLKHEYSTILSEYEDLGHTTRMGPLIEQNDEQSYYLPHHAVFKPSSTSTKTRVVFDASAKGTGGVSLNDILMTGPTLQEELVSILMRWRMYRFAFTADITKMYRQVEVRIGDRKYQRFVYRKNAEEEIQVYEHNMVTFGVTSATFLAVKSLQQLAVEEKESYPKAADIVLKDFYMDDGMSGADTEGECVELCRDLRELLARGMFELRKFVSNSTKVLESIPERDRELALPMEINMESSVKTLGLHYHPTTDHFQFKVNLNETNEWPTKRSLLSETSKLFDPLGWLAPVIIKAKILFQGLWQAGLSWDQKLPEDIAKKWLEFRSELHMLEGIAINRWIGKSFSTVNFELHGFSDASEKAYAAVIYARMVDQYGVIHVSLLTSKTRVAPIRPITLPRLELCGLVLLASLMETVKKALVVKDENIHAWTDSTIVLGWLRTNPARLKTFVANRVVEVHNNFNVNQCHHIEGSKNPADCASRGINPSELKDHSLWWNGPDCLRENQSSWIQDLEIPEVTLELKTKIISSHVINSGNEFDELLKRYSSFERLVKITAICMKFMEKIKGTKKASITALCLTFINNIRERKQRPQLIITTKDLRKAEKRIIKLCQGQEFTEEIHHLANKQPISKKSKLLPLNPFLDVNGCLRVGGRLAEADLPFERKHPLILGANRIAKLIIEDMHSKSMHGGIKLTMSLVRERFWIMNLRKEVKKSIHSCVKCCRYKKEATEQLMANLPASRVNVSFTFIQVGVDYAGPFNLKASNVRAPPLRIKPIMVNGEIKKSIPKVPVYEGYIAVFVCLATKAIHLEVVSDKTTEVFLAAFDRFTARRGFPECCHSDNGTTFIGAEPILSLEKGNSMLDFEMINQHVTKSGTDWKFIPPRAPHHGGIWEAGVKSMKHHLKRIIGDTTLTYEEMATVLTKIEAILNSRPLCAVTDDPDDMTVLTPGHFLIGRPLIARPEENSNARKIGVKERWHLVQKIQRDFWKAWSEDYLNELQTRQKWLVQQRNFQIGDMVLSKEDNISPTKWPLARIVKVHPSKDDNVRSVTIKFVNSAGRVSEYVRPITKLRLLPTNEYEEGEIPKQDN